MARQPSLDNLIRGLPRFWPDLVGLVGWFFFQRKKSGLEFFRQSLRNLCRTLPDGTRQSTSAPRECCRHRHVFVNTNMVFTRVEVGRGLSFGLFCLVSNLFRPLTTGVLCADWIFFSSHDAVSRGLVYRLARRLGEMPECSTGIRKVWCTRTIRKEKGVHD